ncbi:MAG: trypsin-like peptidase domain-containing protein [Candidatus Niyogibacteria bacterium]|nr:trypsin-like peptidase domain-containing protein [Candidatus Niyogibacteria bacterium]
MKKIGVFVVLVFIAIVGIGAYFYIPSPDGEYDNNNVLVDPAAMDRIKASVVRIVSATMFETQDGAHYPDSRSVSGTVVAEKYILTVAHVVAPDGEFEVMVPFQGRVTMPAKKVSEWFFLWYAHPGIPIKLIHVDRVKDFAIFELPPNVVLPSFPYAMGKSVDLKTGNFLYVFGYPLSLSDVNVRPGIVSGLSLPFEWNPPGGELLREDFFMVSNGIISGDSGGPLVAIRDGAYEFAGLSSSNADPYVVLGAAGRIDAIREAILNDCPECPDELKDFFKTDEPAKPAEY